MKSLRIITLSIILLWCPTAESLLAQTDLTPYQDNPIITTGQAGSWDAGIVFLPSVIENNGTFHLFYAGCRDLLTQPSAIGYATSGDGLSFDKSSSNPIFEADGSGFDAYSISEPVVIKEDSTWILYYNARSSAGPGPGPAIGRATNMIDPSVPVWTRNGDPVLEVGSPGEWDDGFVTPHSVLIHDSGYVMYYSGATGYPFQPIMIGMATSTDGILWTKYDDPSTTDPPYAESDPVIQLGASGNWDSGYAWECAVLNSGSGWEMYYTGDTDTWTGEWIGYATSPDGIEWTQFPGNPLLGPNEPWATTDVLAGSAIMMESSYYLYYSGLTSMTSGQIGVATSPTTGISADRHGITIPKSFSLAQNYPNPFNPQTTMKYELKEESKVLFTIHDLRGKLVRTLLDQNQDAGVYQITWDGRDESGVNVTSGVYLYSIRAGDRSSQVRKMILVK